MLDSHSYPATNERATRGWLPSVLLISLVFSPDGVSTASIVSELAKQLCHLGHPVRVFTTTPHYNRDPDILAMQSLRPKWGRLLFQSEYHAIQVYHARMPSKGRRMIARLGDYLGFHAISTVAGARLGGNYEVVLAPSPPLTIGLSAMVLARLRRVPFVYNVQEIYPDIAVSLGMLRNRWLIRLLEGLERFVYAQAQAVVVISESFRKQLLAKGVPAEKLHVIPNFVDVEFVQPGDRTNDFSTQHGLDNRFVVSFAGNLGLTQDLETIVAAARLLRDLPEVRFLIVGDGARRSWLREQLARETLENVQLLPYQPRSVVPLIYASSDLCLVTMKRDTTRDTFPSKIYTIMAAGRPALVSADADSELAWLIEEAAVRDGRQSRGPEGARRGHPGGIRKSIGPR